MGKYFSRLVNEYFSFLQKDRIGVLTLAILILITIFGHLILNQITFIPKADFTEFKQTLEKWENQQLIHNKQVLFVFDPNTVSKEKLDCLAVPTAIKSNIIRYRAAGGKFFRSDDLRKIYGMNDSIFSTIEPYILFENNFSEVMEKTEFTAVKVRILSLSDSLEDDAEKNVGRVNNSIYNEIPQISNMALIDLNSADSAELTELYGIGPVFAARIIKYRNLLGGFYSENQLLEVYGFKEETFNRIKDYIIADTTKIKKLRINFVDYADLIRHPYVKKQHVESILNYRRLNGPFTILEQVINNELMDSLSYKALKPYLTCR